MPDQELQSSHFSIYNLTFWIKRVKYTLKRRSLDFRLTSVAQKRLCLSPLIITITRPRSISSGIINTLDMSWVLGRRRQPVVSDPFLSFDDVASTVKRVAIYRSQKTAVWVNKVVVPHDSSAFLGRKNKICQVTVDAQVKFVRGGVGAFQFLRGNNFKKELNIKLKFLWCFLV